MAAVKTRYNAQLLERIKCWARDGLTEREMAGKIGVAMSTFSLWKLKYSELSESLKINKAVVDDQVVGALLKRAMGFEYEEKKMIIDESGKKRIEKTTKFVPPDSTAMIFWLKNRNPEKWREKRETELTGKNGGPIELKNTGISLEGLTDEELEKLNEIASRVKPDNTGNDSPRKS